MDAVDSEWNGRAMATVEKGLGAREGSGRTLGDPSLSCIPREAFLSLACRKSSPDLSRRISPCRDDEDSGVVVMAGVPILR